MFKIVHKYRFSLLAFFLVCGFLVTPGVKRALQINNSLTIWFLEDSQEMRQYKSFQDHFGGDESMVVVLRHKKGILSDSPFASVTNLCNDLAAMPEVERVSGLSQSQEIKMGLTGPYVTPVFPPNISEEEIRKKLEQHSELVSFWVSGDSTSTQVWVQLKSTSEMDRDRGQIIADIKNTIEPYNSEFSIFLGGVGVIFEGLNTLSKNDFGTFLGGAYVLVLLLVALIFRRARYVFYVLSVIALSTYFTLGLYGLFGFRLNLMSTLIPLIISVLGLLDVIHIINEKIHFSKTNPESSNLEVLTSIWKPCLFTSTTTMAGFIAVTFTDLPVLQSFGWFSALGIFACLIFSFFLGLFFIGNNDQTPEPIVSMRVIFDFLDQKKKTLRFLFITLVLAIGFGAFFTQVDTDTLHYFPKDHKVVQDHDSILTYWGPYMPFEMTLEYPHGIDKKEVFDGALAFASWMDSVPQVARSIEIFSFINQNRILAGIPHKRVLDNMKALYPQSSSQLFTSDLKMARITAFGSLESAASVKSTAEKLIKKGQTFLPEGAQLKAAGYLPLYGGVANKITTGQIRSLGLAILFIFILVWIFFKNLKWALIALITNLIPVLVMFGTMGWLAIPFDLATISIAAIGLSFCIDDSLHFIYGYSQYPKATHREAYQNTFVKVGYAIFMSSVILFLGYSIMLAGNLKTVILFGGLLAEMIAMALLSQWILFPWFLDWKSQKTKI